MSNRDSISPEIRRIPKVELHVHLEGAVSPLLLKQMVSARGDVLASPWRESEFVYPWTGFQGFIDAYDAVSGYLKTAADLTALTYTYLMTSHQDGVIYAELTVSPGHAFRMGLSYLETINAVSEGIGRARDETGIEARIIVVIVRHRSPENCERIVRDLLAFPHPMVVGLGLAGMEEDYPAPLFTALFREAKHAGYGLTAHAGEWTGPDHIRQTIETLGVSRLGHGVRAIEDEKLIAEINALGIHLEVCPLSNIALKVYPNYQQHPLKRLVHLGVSLSLNSDDPPFFNTNMCREYQEAVIQGGLSYEDLYRISLNAVASSFADESLKKTLSQKISTNMLQL